MYKYGYVDAYKYDGDNTVLHLVIPNEKIHQLNRYSQDGKVPVEIRIGDGRNITIDQRKKFYAIIGDIAKHTGTPSKMLEEEFKNVYKANTGIADISLSNCSVSDAKELINIAIECALDLEVPMDESALYRTDDINRYLYMCIIKKKCCISGRKADLHHCTGSTVGMGSNRRTISHSKREFLPLSREYHTLIHVKGDKWFFEEYKVYGLKLDDDTLKELGYKVDEIEVDNGIGDVIDV